MRDGHESTISLEGLVVGDIVFIKAGDQVPADCIMFETTDVACDEGALTGEPEALHKFAVTAENYDHNPSPFVLKSTLISTGEGKAIVCAVGK